jgi:hypothetical protein
MDFQNLVDAYGMAAAVLSVEKTEDGHWGEIRIVRANKLYKDIQISFDFYFLLMPSISSRYILFIIISSSEMY